MTECTILAQPHPFRTERVTCQVRAGQTLAQMLGADIAHSCEVTIGGYVVPRQLWARVRPKAGQQINVRVFPQGGDGKKWLYVIVAIVVTVLTYGAGAGWFAAGGYFAAGSVSAAVLAAGIAVVGSLLLNSLVPPPPGMNAGKSDPYDPLQSITGTQNQAVPYGSIPCVVGQARFYPPHAALPYTEVLGSDQYLRMMLDLGYGDLDVSDIKIGETPIANYDDVQWEITKTPTLFTQDIAELQVGTALNTSGASDLRVTQNPTDEISIEIAFGQGLFAVDKKGRDLRVQVVFTVEYREFGSATWLNAASAPGRSSSMMYPSGLQMTIGNNKRQLLRAGMRWKVPTGQYEVRITRGATTAPANQAQYDDATWTVLRSVSAQNPSTTGTTKLCVRIRATDQLNGVISTLNCVAAQKVRRFDSGMNELPPVASNNPAWVWLWLMTQCPATVRRLADDRVDIAAVAQWAAECEAKDYVISTVADSGRNFGDLLRDVLACGRASFGVRNGKYAPVRDIPQVTPVQMFTPANSWGFAYSRSFAQPPHALRVKFKNPDQAGQVDVRTVYWNGFDENNATRFEDLDLRMVDQPDAAWRLARYHLAVMWLRPTQYVLNADIEHLMLERGDLVHVAHDVTGWGAAWGRVVAVSGTTITVDNTVTLEPGKTYQFRVRNGDNTQEAVAITSPAGETTTLTLSAAVDAQPGDLWVVGEVSRGVAALIVRAVEPREDMKATLTLVDAAPGVWTADAGTPPPFISEITGTPWCSPPEPPSVTIRPGDSAPDDGGVVTPDPGVGGDSGPGGIERGVVRGGNGTPVRPFQVRLQ